MPRVRSDLCQLLAAVGLANETGDRSVDCVDEEALADMTASRGGKVDANVVACGFRYRSALRYQRFGVVLLPIDNALQPGGVRVNVRSACA